MAHNDGDWLNSVDNIVSTVLHITFDLIVICGATRGTITSFRRGTGWQMSIYLHLCTFFVNLSPSMYILCQSISIYVHYVSIYLHLCTFCVNLSPSMYILCQSISIYVHYVSIYLHLCRLCVNLSPFVYIMCQSIYIYVDYVSIYLHLYRLCLNLSPSM